MQGSDHRPRIEADLPADLAEGGLILKGLIWIYFFLLVFEGAFRKWWLPGMSNIFLIIRDPVMVLILLEAARTGFLRINLAILGTLCLAMIALLFGLMAEHANLVVTLFGLRANFLHIPLIFIMGATLSYRSVRQFGWVTAIMMIPMAWVMYQQFSSGQDSIWNVGAGGQIGGQITSAMGKVRASATFSFISGPAFFVPFASAYLLCAFTDRNLIPFWLAIPAGLAVPLAAATSASRSLVAGVGIVFFGMVFAGLQAGKMAKRLTQILMIMGVVFLVASQTDSFQEANEVLMERFAMASNDEGGFLGFVGRFFEGFVKPFRVLFAVPILGTGIGTGTNAAGALLAGNQTFGWQEDEWSRCMMELGPVFGLAYVLLRISLGILIFRTARESARQGNLLPMALFTAGGLNLVMGQWGVSTSAGFGAFVPGLVLAASRRRPTTPISPPTLRKPVLQEVHGTPVYRPGRFTVRAPSLQEKSPERF